MINMMADASGAPTSANSAKAVDQVKLTADYVNYAAQYDKHYYTTSDFNSHKTSYEENDDYIRRCNEKADASGDRDAVHCGHNFFSDMTSEEFNAFSAGLPEFDEGEIEEAESAVDASAGGRRLDNILDNLPNNVNHRKWMGPVKTQSVDGVKCGSCGAMTATSVLEATIAMQKADKNYSQRISEQHLVDCTMDTEKTRELFGEQSSYGKGCSGGWMHKHWEF